MSFDTFLQAAWNDHAKDSATVAGRLPEGISLLEKPEQIPLLARLIVHVMGEHLGEWSQGLGLVEQLRQSAHFTADSDAGRAVARSSAILQLCQGEALPAGFSASDRVRILATAAGSLSAQREIARAEKFFREALSIVRTLDKADPAQRDMAVTCNNLAAALEEKVDRNFRETELMLVAAHASRRQWEIAGGWLEVLRAEYRLAMSFLAAGKAGDAVRHAELALETGAANAAPPIELFFAREAHALAEHARGSEAWRSSVAAAKAYLEELSSEDRAWCEATFQKLSELS